MRVITLIGLMSVASLAHAHQPGQCANEIEELHLAITNRGAVYSVSTDDLVDDLNRATDAEIRFNNAIRAYLVCAEMLR